MNSAFIVDDEPLARKRIKSLLKGYQTIELVGESGEVLESVEKINLTKPDLLFLDIQLKGKKGFRILELIDSLPLVIFTTAYSEYAIRAFDYYAIDYLLKPFNDERFHRSVTRAVNLIKQQNGAWESKIISFLENMSNEQVSRRNNFLDRIPVRIGDTTHFVDTRKIKYIKASAYYAELYTEDGKHIIRESLSSLIEQLDPTYFIRVHRSSIINIDFLKDITSIGFGDIEIKMNDGQQLRVSKTYKVDLVSKLGLK